MADKLCHTTTDLEEILREITFINTALDFKWRFEFRRIDLAVFNEISKNNVGIEVKKGWVIWASFERPDTLTGLIGRGRGRDEIIFEGSTTSNVVKTCWLLVELMVRHELMEGFRYRNARIFNPHNSVEDLVNIQRFHDDKYVNPLMDT